MNAGRMAVLAGALIASTAFAAKPQVQWNASFDFSAIDSFAWKNSPAAVSLEQSDPFLHSHIVNTIEFELTNRGLTETDSNPDVLVTYYGTVESEIQLQSDSYGYGWGAYGSPGWNYYGYGRSRPVTTTTRVVEYETGTLVIDIIDAASNTLIWRGSASGISVTNDAARMRKNITKAIGRIVKQSQKLLAN